MNRLKASPKRWDVIDDSIVITNIQKYPGNLKLAFAEAGVETGRTESSVAQRYYSTLRNGDTIIAIGSEQGVISNTKVVVFKGDDDVDARKAMLIAMFNTMDPAVVIETFLSILTMEEQKSLFKRVTSKLL